MILRGISFVSIAFFSATIAASAHDVTSANATLYPTKGNQSGGFIQFTKEGDGLRVKGEIRGLTEGKHGFHIHQYGDCSSLDGKSAGGHFNPHNVQHGGPDSSEKHVGDLGNVEADKAGLAKVDVVLDHISLGGESSIIGRGVIVHAGADDLKSQPTGAAGGRVACGVIGVSQ
jgi:Cu-Zn family superoxide dismutase